MTSIRGSGKGSRASPATAYTMRDVDEMGMRRVTAEAIKLAARAGWIRFTLLRHGLNRPPPRTGDWYPVPGGLSYREAHLMMEAFNDAGIITSASSSRSTRRWMCATALPSWPSS